MKNETVTASLNNSNDVEIYVKVVDNAGHETEATKDLKIDITHPTIAVTYDLNTPLNERYYKDVRTATVVVTERNFDRVRSSFQHHEHRRHTAGDQRMDTQCERRSI